MVASLTSPRGSNSRPRPFWSAHRGQTTEERSEGSTWAYAQWPGTHPRESRAGNPQHPPKNLHGIYTPKNGRHMFFSRRYITFVFSQKPSFFGLSMLDFGGVDIQSYRRWGWVFFHPQNKHLLRWKAKMEVQTHTQPHRSVWLEDFEQSRGSHVRKLKKIDGPAWVSVDAQQRQCYETMFVDCMLGVRKRVYVKGATSNIHIWILQSVIGIWST